MTIAESKKFKQLFPIVRSVLNEQWDPIGDCPEDEYDSYVHKICSFLLNEKADSSKIANYLHMVEKTSMGFGASAAAPASLEKVGKKIIDSVSSFLEGKKQ